MVPRRYTSEGVILFRRNFSEADRIVTIFSKHYGKLTFIAKGVRKPSSRKRGSLEVFSRIKFAAARGKNMDVMTEVEMIDSFNGIRDDLKKISVAYFFMETVDKLTRDGEKNVDLYSQTLKYIRMLKTTNNLRSFREEFIRDTLVLLGFWPNDKPLKDPDGVLVDVVEREMSSVRVGKKIQ